MAKQGKRQIGSTIKHFVYTFAIDHLGLTPCTMVPNLPVPIETANGTAWSPKEAVSYTHLDVYKRQPLHFMTQCDFVSLKLAFLL